MRKFWTEEENNTIIKGITEDNLNYRQITDLLPDRAYRSVAVQGNKLLGALVKIDYWSETEEEDLILLREDGYNIIEIADILERDYFKVKQKVSQLIKKGKIQAIGHRGGPKGVDSNFNPVAKSSMEELEFYVKTYKVKDSCPGPYRSRILKHYGSWTKALIANNLPLNIGGVMDINRPTTLYLLKFDGFYKVGITQQTLKKRFTGGPSFLVLDTYVSDLTEIVELEKQILTNVISYIPDDPWFERNGKTECFITDQELKEISDLL